MTYNVEKNTKCIVEEYAVRPLAGLETGILWLTVIFLS